MSHMWDDLRSQFINLVAQTKPAISIIPPNVDQPNQNISRRCTDVGRHLPIGIKCNSMLLTAGYLDDLFAIKPSDQNCERVVSSDHNIQPNSIRTRFSFNVKPGFASGDDVFPGPPPPQLSLLPAAKRKN